MFNNAFSRFFQLVLLSIFLSTYFIPNAISANNPLEIINIKPANSGNPAIPSTNRIFNAYPGIEYNIRPAVIGGSYPYFFSLKNQPSGMTINTHSGEISWPNPQANSGTIVLTVTDSDNPPVTVSTTWSIAVSTSGFLFIDASYAGSTENGSITQPFKSIDHLLNGVTESTREHIVYFRRGNYTLPVYLPSYYLNLGCNLDSTGNRRPYKWIGYPGETANINAAGHYIESHLVYFDNLNFTNFTEYGIRTASGSNYNTVRRCDFSGLTTTRTSNNNQGFYFTEFIGTGNYHVIQQNNFHNYTGASAIGSLYYINKILIEDNHIYDFTGSSPNGLSTAIAYKASLSNGTIRGNKIKLGNSSDAVLGTSVNGNFNDSSNTEICFNIFDVGASRIAHRFNIDGFRSQSQGLTYYYRNTVIGDILFQNIDGANCSAVNSGGPWKFYDNVIINPLTAGYAKLNHLTYHYSSINSPQNCISDTNSLKGLPTDNIVNTNDGSLTMQYSSSKGKKGRESGTYLMGYTK